MSYDAVILGAGILGLATADALTSAGLKVAILARDLPQDLDSAAFASPWAGANWSSFAANPAEQRRDTITFEKFAELAHTHPEIVQRRKFCYIWDEDAGYSKPWYRELVGEFRPLHAAEVPAPYKAGVHFLSFTLNPPRLLAYLSARLAAAGVPVVRARVSSLDEAFAHFPKVGLVINATGLGARALLGVADPAVHPVRGQTVLVRAPAVDTCYGVRDANLPPGTATYIIPRPGSGGCVIVGGTVGRDDYSTLACPLTAERILKNAFAIEPKLAPGGSSWRDIEVVSHNVGLRPARDGGLRLEMEEKIVGEGELVPAAARGRRKVHVLHCYGIGPAGYQASFGVADEAKNLVLKHLASKKGAKL